MKKISIFGSVGFNIGDEAIAVAAANCLRTLDRDIEIYISSLHNNIINKYNGIDEFLIDRKSLKGWVKLVKQIKNSDIIVLGGGTMIQDKLGISLTRGMIPYMLQISIIAKFLNKKLVTLPIGVDKLNTRLGKILASHVLMKIDKLHVRDENSKRLAAIYSNKGATPVVSVDPAFFLKIEDEIEFSFMNKKKYVAISLVNENLETDKFLPAILKSIEFILENTDYYIALVPMDRRESEEISLFKIIRDNLKEDYKDKIKIINPNLNVYEITSILRNSQLLIAMRLHAMILSLGYTPIIGISRTTKTENFLNEYSDYYLDINKNKINSDEIINIINEWLQMPKTVVESKLTNQRKSVQQNFKVYRNSISELLRDN
ncbi:polysaccharide pyruvyl transferase family protein [Heyndrickxia coagulans]|uniref:polysaccharide pyruvyl transferase family protein n=1 Tax=Heyndrickxia coagulans TaxID=1398 RepID=UPI002E1AA130|nr:polysaccharide pyruvyl transferase family protein [Heyndrickxia coagulans]